MSVKNRLHKSIFYTKCLEPAKLIKKCVLFDLRISNQEQRNIPSYCDENFFEKTLYFQGAYKIPSNCQYKLFLATELARLDAMKTGNLLQFRQSSKLQNLCIEMLVKAINVQKGEKTFPLQKYLPQIQALYDSEFKGQFKIFVFGQGSNLPFYSTGNMYNKYPLALFIDEKTDIYEVIVHISQYFGKRYFCFTCLAYYSHPLKHSSKCRQLCNNCRC